MSQNISAIECQQVRDLNVEVARLRGENEYKNQFLGQERVEMLLVANRIMELEKQVAEQQQENKQLVLANNALKGELNHKNYLIRTTHDFCIPPEGVAEIVLRAPVFHDGWSVSFTPLENAI